MIRRIHRRCCLLLVGIASLLVAWPRSAWAACSLLTDPASCLDGAQYAFWVGIVRNLWAIDRSLLQLSYSIDQLRWWIVDTGFGAVYTALQSVFGPLLGPMATIAILIGLLSYVLAPVVGRLNIVDLRQTFLWLVLAPFVLAQAGTMLGQVEAARTSVTGVIMEQGVQALTNVPTFGARATDMPAPKILYSGGNPCGGGGLTRRDRGVQADDLAAAMVDANAQDIQCPNAVGPSSDTPDAFCDAGSRVYYVECAQDIGSDLDANGRQAAIERVQAGVTRLTITILPCLLAVTSATVQLVLSLALVTLFLAVPIGLVVVYFQQTSSGITSLFRRGIGVMQVSWSISAVLGIVLVCLRATAELGNATAYAGFSGGALILNGYFLILAFQTLSQSITTINSTAQMAVGLTPTAPVALGGQALAAGAALATGGTTLAAGAALAGMQAYQATGNAAYAAGAAAGRVAPTPLLQAGAVAEAMGITDRAPRLSDMVDGSYAGARSARSPLAARTAFRADAVRKDADGQTVRDRAEQRRVAVARQPDVGETVERDGDTVRRSTAAAPDTALTVATASANVPRLLQRGYRVHRNTADTYQVWKPAAPSTAVAANPTVALARERLELVSAGALRGNRAAARATLTHATRMAVAEEAADARDALNPPATPTGQPALRRLVAQRQAAAAAARTARPATPTGNAALRRLVGQRAAQQAAVADVADMPVDAQAPAAPIDDGTVHGASAPADTSGEPAPPRTTISRSRMAEARRRAAEEPAPAAPPAVPPAAPATVPPAPAAAPTDEASVAAPEPAPPRMTISRSRLAEAQQAAANATPAPVVSPSNAVPSAPSNPDQEESDASV